MRIIALVNHKGGVGKTTSAINISAGLARKGKNVLAIDCDPQSNLTESLGVSEPEKSINDAFIKGEPLPIIKIKKNLSLVPSILKFADAELIIAGMNPREYILKELIEGIGNGYDYCIIDCPPSLGIITLNALVAADEVFIPMEAEFLAYRGLDSIKNIIEKVKKYYNKKLEISNIFFTQYKDKLVLSKEISKLVEQDFGKKMMKTNIRVNVALAESQSFGKDIFEYAAESNGAKDYESLVNEILKN